MAKVKISRKKANNKGNKANNVVRRQPTRGLDPAALAYARLLSDPCGAPLVHPIYAGGDAGYLVRADSVHVIGLGPNYTAGFMQWTPGLLDDGNKDFIAGASTDWETPNTAGNYGYAPGKGFISSNASAARCVAACLRITFPGSESARSGWIQYGHASGRSVVVGGSYSGADVGLLCNNYSRTPADTVEVFWKPNFIDQEMVDPTVVKDQSAKNAAILLAWGGLPSNVGLTVHLTAIYEWQPQFEVGGIAAPTTSKAVSSNTLDQVIDYLTTRGFTWVRDTAHGVMTAATAGAMSAVFGMMPASTRSRSRAITY